MAPAATNVSLPPIMSSDPHAQQSDVDIPNILEDADPFLGDFEKVSHANNLTKNITTSERIIVEDFNVTSSVTVQSTSRHSSSSSSSFEQATKEGGSDLDPNQGIKY